MVGGDRPGPFSPLEPGGGVFGHRPEPVHPVGRLLEVLVLGRVESGDGGHGLEGEGALEGCGVVDEGGGEVGAGLQAGQLLADDLVDASGHGGPAFAPVDAVGFAVDEGGPVGHVGGQ